MRTARLRTRSAALVAAMALTPALTACATNETTTGGPVDAPSGASTTPGAPTASEPTSETTEEPEPEETSRPLSRFEDNPGVKVLRTWADEVARATNDGNLSFSNGRHLMTPHGVELMDDAMANEVELKVRYPGPLPFTPRNVTRPEAGRMLVPACVQGTGFALDRKTKLPAEKRRIDPVLFTLVKADGSWRVDDFHLDEADCSNIPVKGVPW